MSTDRNLEWWQKLLVALKLWQPPHRTKHHEVRDMERPVPPPVTGDYGNRVVTSERPRLVPQRADQPATRSLGDQHDQHDQHDRVAGEPSEQRDARP